MVQQTFPRVVAFGGGAGLRRTLGGLSAALRQPGAAGQSGRLTAVASVSEPPHRAGETGGHASSLADIPACVLPATVDDVTVDASLEGDGRKRRLRISGRARPVPELLQRIVNADVIVVGPGSLYTSLLPSLLVGGVAATVSGVNAVRIYVANLMTEPGETDGFTVADCLDVIRDHARANLFDYVLVNRTPIDPATIATRGAWGAQPMALGLLRDREPVVVDAELAEIDEAGGACHAPAALALAVLRLARRGRAHAGLQAIPGTIARPATAEAVASVCYERMIAGGLSFWEAAYEPFMRRDLTREIVRAVVRRGLARTNGNYRLLSQLFSLPSSDYERFLAFLHEYDCDVPFRHSA